MISLRGASSLQGLIASCPRPSAVGCAVLLATAGSSGCSSAPHDTGGGSTTGGDSGSGGATASADGSTGGSMGSPGTSSSSGGAGSGAAAASGSSGGGSGAGVANEAGAPPQGGSGSSGGQPDAASATPRPTAGDGGGEASADSGGTPGGSGDASAIGLTTYPYVFSVFDDSAPISDLKIYTSSDALNFTLLYDTGYTGPSGFLRDPSIMKNTDGKFYVAFTTPPTLACCGPEASFSIASSANLKDWTTVATVPCGVPGTTNTWAPEWFKDLDGSVYAIANVDGKSYSYKAMNQSMTMFSAPTWIGIGPGYIDTFILTIGATYHAFTKNNATYVEHATASSLNGPWTFVGQNDWAGWGTHKEAPALILLPSGTWRFYTDAGSSGHEMYSDSADVFQTWTAPKTLPVVGNNISHGTVIKAN